MAQAAEVIHMDENQKAVAVQEFNVTDATIEEIKEYEKLNIKDTVSEKTVRKCRANVRSLRTDVEARRKELKAPLIKREKLIDDTAKILTSRILPTERRLNEKIKAVEAEKERKRKEKEQKERERLQAIQSLMEKLQAACSIQYGKTSEQIQADLDHLKLFEISSVDYQERTEEAEGIKAQGISQIEQALKDRQKYEQEQAELEAERKRQEEERQKMEAERKAQEEADRKKAEEEAEARRKEQEKLEAERKAIEKEKAEIEAKKQAEKEAEEARKQFEADHVEALEMNAEFDRQRAEKLKADEERRAMVEPDKKELMSALNNIEESIKSVGFGELKTEEAKTMSVQIIERLMGKVHELEESVKNWN